MNGGKLRCPHIPASPYLRIMTGAKPATTVVIVDDDQHAREVLSGALACHHPDMRLLGMAGSVGTGIELITRLGPDVLFLDVELGDRTGFDLLEALGMDRPHVIFTTAHVGYAVKAIRFSALDFLLKPVDPDEMGLAVDKAVHARDAVPQHSDQFIALLRNLLPAPQDQRIALPVSNGLEVISTHDIVYCRSAGGYSEVHRTDGSRLVVCRSLGDFEGILRPEEFIRVHHTHLVNVRHVRKYIRGEGGELIMVDGSNITVSRRKRQDLLDALARM